MFIEIHFLLPMFILLIGPPGCGKGTLCKRLSGDLGYIHISTGDILRKEAESNKKLRDILARGEYVSDEFTTELLVKSTKDKKSYLLDGYPRTLTQAHLFDDIFGLPSLVIHMKLCDSISRQRIISRNEGRADDKEDVLSKRFGIYHTRTEPILDHYLKKGVLVEVDASQNKEDVFTTSLALIKDKES